MNGQAITKVVKAAILIAGFAGYNVSPEDVNTIIEGVTVLFSLVYLVEAELKRRKGGGDDSAS